MKTHNIDSIFKKAIEESEDFYNSEANGAKEKIWVNIQTQKRKQPTLILLWTLAAACIILLFSSTVIIFLNYKAQDRIETLVELNNNLKKDAVAKNQNYIAKQEPEKLTISNSTDTVYIEKEVKISKPTIITKVISDTIFIEQIVYVEKEVPVELIAKNENINQSDSTTQAISQNNETQILIRNRDKEKKGKRKKVQIKFGGNNSQANSGTLAYTKKL